MIGELIALASAALYALSGVSIARGAAERPDVRGDNGAFLSILLTALFSLVFWMGTGGLDVLTGATATSLWTGIALFVAAGVFSTVLGRVAMFRSVKRGGAVRASMMRRLTPVFAAIFAVLLLAEIPSLPALAGMAFILAGTAVLGRLVKGGAVGRKGWVTWGATSAGCYGLSYVLRKMALAQLPGAAFGALIGAVTGLFWYVFVAPFSPRASRAMTQVFRDAGRWQILTATTLALAQIGQFVALSRTDVATVAIIGSTETIISIFLAGYVFGTEAKPGPLLWAGAILSTIGVVMIALFSGNS